MSQYEPLTAENYTHYTENPIQTGCYPLIFVFTGTEQFNLCHKCNAEFHAQYLPDIITEDLQVYIDSSANYDAEIELYCDHCGNNLSAYAEE